MNNDPALDYSVRKWRSGNRGFLPAFARRILLPGILVSIFMVAIGYLLSPSELRVPVKKVELRSESFYESAGLEVEYIQRSHDAVPVLYAKRSFNPASEALRGFILGVAAAGFGVMGSKNQPERQSECPIKR